MFNFEEWIKKAGNDEDSVSTGKRLEKYHNVPVVDVKKELSAEVLNIIKRLGIEIKDEIYTEYEFDILEGDVFDYYIYEGMEEEEKIYVKSLEGTDVTQEEVSKAIHEIYAISEKHNF